MHHLKKHAFMNFDTSFYELYIVANHLCSRHYLALVKHCFMYLI